MFMETIRIKPFEGIKGKGDHNVTSPTFFNGTNQLVFKPKQIEISGKEVNQRLFHTNTIIQHITSQTKLNDSIFDSLTKNSNLLSNLMSNQSALKREFESFVFDQGNYNKRLTTAFSEHERKQGTINDKNTNQLLGLVDYYHSLVATINTQKKEQESLSATLIEQGTQIAILVETLEKQEDFNEKILGNTANLKEFARSLEVLLEEQQGDQHHLSEHIAKHAEDIALLIHFMAEQKQVNNKVSDEFIEHKRTSQQFIKEQIENIYQKLSKKYRKLRSKNKQLRKEQKEKLVPLLEFVDNQENFNTQATKEFDDLKQLHKHLHFILENQGKEQRELVERVNIQNNLYDQLLVNVQTQEEVQNVLSEKFTKKMEDDLDLIEFIEEQKTLMQELLEYLNQQEERYDILTSYIRNQENFNHKLFDYICDQFDKNQPPNTEQSFSN